jgi:hypothetical protein
VAQLHDIYDDDDDDDDNASRTMLLIPIIIRVHFEGSEYN